MLSSCPTIQKPEGRLKSNQMDFDLQTWRFGQGLHCNNRTLLKKLLNWESWQKNTVLSPVR